MSRLSVGDSAVRRGRELAGASNAADFSEALARGLAVLAAFGSEHRRLTQAELARELGLSRATVRRAVLTLEHLGYLEADGRSYQLTPQVLGLAAGYLTSNLVSSVLQPACDEICADVEESCSVAVLSGAEMIMIARAVPRRLIAVGSGIGYRVPSVSSALGRALLAHLPDGERDRQFAALVPEGEQAALRDVLGQVRADGYCYVANDVESGFQSIAVPLRRWDGQPVAALNLGCHTDRMAPEVMRGQILDLLRDRAEQLRPRLI
jgi:IclR family transcriptional regulator, pca regulon regulatory protein